MLKKCLFIILILLACSRALAIAGDGPRYVLLPNIKTQYLMSINASTALALQDKIIHLVQQTLNITKASPYQSIRIRTIYGDNNTVSALIVYLLSSKYKSLELVRINLNNNLAVTSIIKNYQLVPEDLQQSPHYANKAKPTCPDERVQFVVGNSFHEDESVQAEVKKVYELAKSLGYNPIMMDINNPQLPQPTVAAYENWLSCPHVKGFYNESHGWNEGIVLADDDFIYSQIDTDLINKMKNNVLLFDSCLTFHNPLLSSMTSKRKANAKQYVAGYISLPFGPSERTASCFWQNAFKHQTLNKQLVDACAVQYDLDPGDFGIAGHGEQYLSPAEVL